jgi:hypothetical protein
MNTFARDDGGKPPPQAQELQPVVAKKYCSLDGLRELYNDIKTYLRQHIDFIDERYYDVTACFILVCRRFRVFDAIPYIAFQGPPESGKSRALDACGALTDEEPLQSASISTAGLFRGISKLKPNCVYIDEADLIAEDRRPETIALLNSGYTLRRPVIRVFQGKDGKWELEKLDVYGPKMIATIKDLPDTTDSRCIKVNMCRARRDKSIRFLIDAVTAQNLRARLHDYETAYEGVPPQKLVRFEPETWGSPRLAQLFYPLFEVAPTIEIEEILHGLALELGTQRKSEDLESDCATVMRAVQTECDLEEQETLDREGNNRMVQGSHILERIKNSLAEEETKFWTPWRIAKLLRMLGFVRFHVMKGSVWKIAANRYEERLKQYVSTNEQTMTE